MDVLRSFCTAVPAPAAAGLLAGYEDDVVPVGSASLAASQAAGSSRGRNPPANPVAKALDRPAKPMMGMMQKLVKDQKEAHAEAIGALLEKVVLKQRGG